MKTNLFTVIIAVTLLPAASCNSSAPKNMEDQKTTAAPAATPQGKDNITGEWELVKVIADNNGDHKIDPDEDNDNAQETKVAASTPSTAQPSGDGIVGYWKLTLEAYDNNENKVLDEAERKKGIKNNYTFRFNADGSCRIQESFTGRYEVKTEGGKQVLYVYRKRVAGEEDKDPVPDVYRIISLNKTEMVLLEKMGDLTFWVFGRAG